MEKHKTIQTEKIDLHEYTVDPKTGKLIKGKRIELKSIPKEDKNGADIKQHS